MLCSPQLYSAVFFFQALTAQSVSSYACRLCMMLQGSLCVCQHMLAVHPFPQRDVCLSEVLRTYRLPLSVPQQMSTIGSRLQAYTWG